MSKSKFQMLSWQNWMWVLCTLLTCTTVIHCEYPVTPALLPENNECNGGTALFNWTYSPITPDPSSVTWTKRNSDGTRAATLATLALATFTVNPAYTGRVTRTGTTGQIELSNIQSTDVGTYRIEVFNVSDSRTTRGTGNVALLEPPNGSLVVTAGDRSLDVSELYSLGIPAARVICKNEQHKILVNDTPPFVQSDLQCGTYICCIESLAVSKCLPSSDPLRNCHVVVIGGLGCMPLLIVGIILFVGGIVITVITVITVGFASDQFPKNTIIVPDLKNEKKVEARFKKYLSDHYANLVQKSDAENGDKVWTIKGGKAHLSFNPPKGKVDRTLEIKFKQGDPSNGTLEIKFQQGDPSIADMLRVGNFIYSIIHIAAGIIMIIIIAVLACEPFVGLCIGALIVSILNLLYGIGNFIFTLTWENDSHIWLRWDFFGIGSGTTPPGEISGIGSGTTPPGEISGPTNESPPSNMAVANSQPKDTVSLSGVQPQVTKNLRQPHKMNKTRHAH